MARVVDYIYLNRFARKLFRRTGSLSFVGAVCGISSGFPARRFLWQMKRSGLEDSPEGWRGYVEQLQWLAVNAAEQERRGFDEMSRGWAIGTAGWRKALAKTYSQMALDPGLEQEELRDLKEAPWNDALDQVLRQRGRFLEQWKRRIRAMGGRSMWRGDCAKPVYSIPGSPANSISEAPTPFRVHRLSQRIPSVSGRTWPRRTSM